MPTASSALGGSFKPTPVSEQQYTRYVKPDAVRTTQLNTIPEIPSASASAVASKGFFSSTILRVGLVALAFIAVGTSVGVPLGLLLQSTTTTSLRTTTQTTVTTTSATTTTTTTTTSRTTTTTATTSTTTSITTSTTTTTATVTAALTVSGPQLNFNLASLSSAWSLCYSAVYATPMYANISSILASCWKSKLLLGCRPVGNSLLTLAAMGNRADVVYNTSASASTTRLGNGVSWYFTKDTGSWNSWGFVIGGDASMRANCDTDVTNNAAYRLCWHLVGSSGGWRCGTATALDSSTTWEKVIYHAM